MFWNVYKKRLKAAFASPDTIIWIFLVPFVLSTMFWFAFQQLDEAELFHPFSIAVVEDSAYQSEETLQAALEAVSGENDSGRIFNLTRAKSIDEADRLLRDGEIEGYLIAGGTLKAVVTKNGLNQTVLKTFADRYEQMKVRFAVIAKENPEALGGLMEDDSDINYVKSVAFTKNQPSEQSHYYYAMMGMLCMYGGFIGMNAITGLQANLSAQGARRTVSPMPRMKLVGGELLAMFTVHLISLSFFLFYINVVQGVSFGSRIPLIFLTCVVGSAVGISFGAAVTSVFKGKMGIKTAVITVVSMFGGFLSGLMVGGIEIIIKREAPIVNLLNPAARITDSFFSLYYYDNLDNFIKSIAIMAAMAAVFLGVTVIFVRRQRYDSI